MPTLKSIGELPGFVFSGALVSPDEEDSYVQYSVMNPSISATYLAIGTFTASTANQAVPTTAFMLDYPRNLAIVAQPGTTGGTVTIAGQDQFGGTINETIGQATLGAVAAGTVMGTKVFARVGTITYSPSNANTGTVNFGVAVATAAAGTPIFGFPTKIGGTADLKSFNWINNGTINVQQTPSKYAGTQFSTFQGTTTLAITDEYVVFFKPTFNNSNGNKLTGLGTT